VAQPLYSIALRDLERTDQTRTWPIPSDWLAQVLDGSEATPEGAPGQLELYLKLSAREVLVKGSARARVVMPCARTLEPVTVELDAPILLLLTPRTPVAPPKRERTRAGAQPERAERSHQRKRATAAEPADPELSEEEAARDHYEGETVVLDEFIREHLLLELPLFPVRSDLPSEEAGVTRSLPDPAGTDEPVKLDPRLAPLAALRSALKAPGAEKK
jgi:DUF177 domain-containing protein